MDRFLIVTGCLGALLGSSTHIERTALDRNHPVLDVSDLNHFSLGLVFSGDFMIDDCVHDILRNSSLGIRNNSESQCRFADIA